jgi:NAD(P)-dependent dehydrogenase (short-subunit alcohol dehydrogenase family)
MSVPTFDFTGQRVLVTGAAGGLGQAVVRAFAAAGARLVLADLALDGIEALARELPGGAECHRYDQAELDSIAALAERVGAVDVLCNNAGALLVKPLLDSTAEEIARVIAVDLLGPMALARAIAPAMAKQGSGVIVNTASQLAFCGAEGRAAYATAKAGLVQFTRSAAVEWMKLGIRVVAVAPGRLLTPMTTFLRGDAASLAEGIARVPAARYGTPEEIAALVLFLASPAAGYIVGETIIADGGYVLG